MNMSIRNYFAIFFSLLIFFSCSNNDDDGGPTIPVVQVDAPEFVKPDSTIFITVTATVPGLLAADGITGILSEGEGTLTRTSLQGENTTTGRADFEFVAGTMENTTALLTFSVLDQIGASASNEIEVTITDLEIKQVVVLNEGNFLSANGSAGLYDIKEGSSDPSAYPASATIQQAITHQEKIYMVTNAPDQVVVLNTELEQENVINEGLDNPVDFAAIDDFGYVSNWGDISAAFGENPESYIALVDLTTNEVYDSVLLESRPQGLLAHQGRIYIALEGSNTVAILNPVNNTLLDITVEPGPSEFVVDGLGMVWVLCTSGALVEIDPSDFSVGMTIDGLTNRGYSERLAINGTGNMIYFLGGTNGSFTGLTTVYSVDLTTQQVSPFIEDAFALYGIGVNPESNDIYLGDSNAFQSTGTGFRYDAQGNKIAEFPTGIGPNGFLFIIGDN